MADVPLVNAHTFDAQHRHWAYKDSYMFSPNAKYIFFKINDQFIMSVIKAVA